MEYILFSLEGKKCLYDHTESVLNTMEIFHRDKTEIGTTCKGRLDSVDEFVVCNNSFPPETTLTDKVYEVNYEW